MNKNRASEPTMKLFLNCTCSFSEADVNQTSEGEWTHLIGSLATVL